MILRFFGSTNLINHPSPPGLDVSVRSTLPKFVRGVNLCHINPLKFDLNALIPCAIRIVKVCGEKEVLNRDARMESFVVGPAPPPSQYPPT